MTTLQPAAGVAGGQPVTTPAHRSDVGVVEAVLTEPERLSALDAPAHLLAGLARWQEDRVPAIVRTLRGGWVGHPVHPALVTVPLGMATAAVVADLLPWTRPAVRPLLGVGTLAALPAVMSGLADLPSVGREGQRVAVVHVTANALGLLLQNAAMVAPFPLSRRLLRAGVLASTVAAAYGGHLAYRNRAHVTP